MAVSPARCKLVNLSRDQSVDQAPRRTGLPSSDPGKGGARVSSTYGGRGFTPVRLTNVSNRMTLRGGRLGRILAPDPVQLVPLSSVKDGKCFKWISHCLSACWPHQDGSINRLDRSWFRGDPRSPGSTRTVRLLASLWHPRRPSLNFEFKALSRVWRNPDS